MRPFLIEGSFYKFNSVTGIARVWKHIFSEWAKNGFLERVILLDRGGCAPDFDGMQKVTIPEHNYADLSQDPTILQTCCDVLNAAALCSTFNAYAETTPTLALIHDMFPERLDLDLSDPMWVEKRSLISKAQYFVCVSENTKRDLLMIHPELKALPVCVGHNGVSTLREDTAPNSINVRDILNDDREFVLFVGNAAPYKGLTTLVNALHRIEKNQRPLLVVVSLATKLPRTVYEALGTDGVCALHATDAELRALYEAARAYVCPSHYEGFGLTLLEAMSCGCPVISSDGGALPEVAGDAAWLFSVGDDEKLAEAISLVRDPKISNLLVMRGYRRIEDFSWQKIANAVQHGLLVLAGEAETSLDNPARQEKHLNRR